MLITEGRKEDIYNKYKSKIDVERKLNSSIESISLYDILIQNPFIQDTNYKFLEPLLLQYYTENEIYPRNDKELEELKPNHPSTSQNAIINKRQFVDTVVPRVQFFENNKDKYPKKDLRQYIGNSFETDFLLFTNDLMLNQSKKKERQESKKESVKLYEDDNILVVKPLTHKASCYYGSGTKWCTTMAGTPSYFEQYTGQGNLYYIILKKINRESKYGKIALLLKPNVKFDDGDFYDTKDHLLTKNEIELFKTFVINNAISAIDTDNKENNKLKWLKELEKEIENSKSIINSLSPKFGVFNELSYNNPLSLEFETLNFVETSDLGDLSEENYGSFLRYSCDIQIECLKNRELDGVINVSGVIYSLNENEFEIQMDFYPDNSKYEFLEDETVIKSDNKTFTNIIEKIISVINQELIFKVTSSIEIKNLYQDWVNKNVKQTYGSFGGSQYTFEGGGKLTKEIIKYLDELPEGQKGNRLEFLQKTGKVIVNDKGVFNPSGQKINLQGYLSSWFSALNKAKIIQTKPGQKGFIKGADFENFKEKILTKK